jgi:hypothetical protein
MIRSLVIGAASAARFDSAAAGEFWAERYNPTEAGSRADGTGEKLSSTLLRFRTEGAELKTTIQMAFWLAPGERTFGRPALDAKKLSDHLISKRVRVGYKKLTHVIEHEVAFTVPKGERHTYAQFEALTRYIHRSSTGSGLEELSDSPGEQEFPVVFANEGIAHARGIFSPDQPSPGYKRAGAEPGVRADSR